MKIVKWLEQRRTHAGKFKHQGTTANLENALKDPRVKIFEAGGDITQTDILDAAMKDMDGVFQFADGKAKLLALEWVDNNEKPDPDFPFWLNSGRVVEHFHTRTRTGKVGNCNKYSPTAYMEINTDAAREMGIEQMEYVRLVSRRGDAVVMAQLTQRVPYNMVFVPFHFYDCVNRVSLGLLDPHSRQPAFKQAAVRIEKVDQLEAGRLNRELRAY